MTIAKRPSSGPGYGLYSSDLRNSQAESSDFKQKVRIYGRSAALLRRLHQGAPLVRLDADHRLVAALPVRLEHGSLAFTDVEPVLAEGIHDVRFVRDDHGIAAGGRRR